MLRAEKASLILDFGTIPVLPGAMCCGKSHGANILPTTVSSTAEMLVMTQLSQISQSFLRRIIWPLSCSVCNSGSSSVEVLGSKYMDRLQDLW